MKVYRVLFHIHTYKSFDATIKWKDLVNIIQKFFITHIVITDHNTIKGYFEFKKFLKTTCYHVTLIPGVEYSTDIGDLIVLNHDELIKFKTYEELVRKVRDIKKQKDNLFLVLPHPGKRKMYPKLVLQNIDFYEILNMRETTKSFNGSIFKNAKILYGSDAHTPFELPGVINVIHTEKEFFKALTTEVIIPEIHSFPLKLHRFMGKLRSKVKRTLKI